MEKPLTPLPRFPGLDAEDPGKPCRLHEFLTNRYQNNVAYYLGGHDHMHHRSMVNTADGSASVSQIICASNSYKFYTPEKGDDGRETPLKQELYTIGYYIFTVDGPLMAVDYYRGAFGLAAQDGNGNWVNAVDLNRSGTPTFKRGPWKTDDALGTWGVDLDRRTVWAVIDHGGTFVAKVFGSNRQGHRGKKGQKTVFL